MRNLLNRLKNIKKRTWIILGVVVVLVVGFLLIRQARRSASSAASLQTATIARGSLTATVGATGTVRARQTAMLSWQTTGTIGSVNVQPGDPVTAGQVLANLDKTSLPQNVIMATADLVSAQQALDTLVNSKTAQANAELALANAQKNFDTANNNYLWQTGQRADQATINNAKAALVVDQQRVDALQKMYNDTATLPNPDTNVTRANAYQNLYAAIKKLDGDTATYNWYTGQPTPNDLAVLKGNLAVAQAALDDAKREWNRLQNGPDPQDILAAQARVDAAQAAVNAARIAAPFAGTVTEVNGLVGDQVGPGTRAFRIDDLSHMQVDVQVSEVDINSIQVGQAVTLSFDAIPSKTYNGKVVSVAQAGDVASGAVNFTVTVELTDTDAQVKPGMTAAVNIVVQQHDNVILVPNQAVRQINGQAQVIVIRNGQTQTIQITLGASSDTTSEVVSGDLRVGDQVVLNPTTSLFTTPGSGRGGRFIFGGGG